MHQREAAEATGLKLHEALRRKIREAGLSLREVEERLGLGRDYLRHLLSGRVDLKVKHIMGVLAVLNIHPAAFFAELYGYPDRAAPPPEPIDPQFYETLRHIQSAAASALARRLKDRGVLTEEDVEGFEAELDREQSKRRA